MATELLQTKLYLPAAHTGLVERPTLIDKLNRGLNGKLTLVCAPAGFGKTMLTVTWVRQLGRPIAYLALDEHDNDLVRFLTYMIAAIQTVAEDVGQTAMAQLSGPQFPAPEPILTSLINDLVRQKVPCVVVWDDYHLVTNGAIHHAVNFLLEHMPPQLHLVITSRADPPLALAKLRGRRQMTEIRAAGLRFTFAETAALFNEQLDLNLANDDVRALTNRTEGWITGLQLAAISMQDRPEPSTFIKAFTGNNQYIVDYLLEEVLQQQPREIQHFLMDTAILQRLSAPLCNHLTGGDNSLEILDYLQQKNLFTSALDQAHTWFRYHHLFADLLKHRLRRTEPDRPSQLHQRASQWYEAHGLITDALFHARMMGDYQRASQLIKTYARHEAYKGESNNVFAWVNSLPPAHIQATPYLSIVKAWEALYLMRLPEIEQHLVQAEHMLPQETDADEVQTLIGEIFPLRAWAAQYQGDSQQAISLSRQALAQLPPDNDHVRSLVLGPLAAALLSEGKTEEAIAVSLEAIDACRKLGNWLASLGIVFELADIYIMCGQLRQAESLLHTTLNDHPADLPAIGQIYCGLGRVAYEKDEIATAITYFQQALDISQRKTVHLYALRYLAPIYISMGMNDQAQSAFDEAEGIIQQWIPTVAQTQLPLLRVAFALQLGDIVAATHWQQQYQLTPPTEHHYQSELSALTLARLLIAQARAATDLDKLAEAQRLLTQLEATAAKSKRWGRVMEAQILRALSATIAEHGGIATHNSTAAKSRSANVSLTNALQRAEAEGYRRLFLNEGRPMARLLQSVPPTPFILDLLNRFPETAEPANDQSALIEPLSDRELEVLRLVAQRYTYGEIATELVVSLNTVRFHMKNIYSKLGVNKKSQAIKRAQEYRLL